MGQADVGTGLDERTLVERLDQQGLLARIEGLPEQCAEARSAFAAFELPESHREPRQLVVLGMGGSAIGGDILRAVAEPESRAPVTVVRGYDLPAWVDQESLVVACTHSGNTEETLSAFQDAMRRGARCVVVTTGGQAAPMAKEGGIPLLTYQFDGEPRSALGWQLMALLAVSERAGLLERQEHAVVEAIAVLREQRDELGFASPAERNPAKQLAGRLHGRLPVIFGAGPLAQAAHRWKTQVNENAKSWAVWDELPELDHNAIAGFALPAEVVPRLHVVFLSHASLHPRVLLRYDVTAEALDRAGVSHERIEAKGSSALAQVLSAVYFGDLTSYYLALINNVQPSPVEELDRMKARLAGL